MKHNWEKYFDVSSEYWKKLKKIYEENESFPKKVVKDRNLHHKFPRSFSKKDGVDIDNDDDNLVSLSLADHFRVHFYLWKCSKKGYRGMMAMAFTLMRKRVVIYASDETIEQLAKDYEEAMREVAEAQKGKKLSAETRKKMREAKKGEKNPFYGKKHSVETKKKMREAKKGEKNPMYGKHHTDEAKKKNAEAAKGKPKSEETRNKMREAHKGKHWFNNGEKCVMSKECPPGFVPGMLK